MTPVLETNAGMDCRRSFWRINRVVLHHEDIEGESRKGVFVNRAGMSHSRVSTGTGGPSINRLAHKRRQVGFPVGSSTAARTPLIASNMIWG